MKQKIKNDESMTEKEFKELTKLFEVYKQTSEFVTLRFKKSVEPLDKVTFGFDSNMYGFILDVRDKENKTYTIIYDDLKKEEVYIRHKVTPLILKVIKIAAFIFNTNPNYFLPFACYNEKWTPTYSRIPESMGIVYNDEFYEYDYYERTR